MCVVMYIMRTCASGHGGEKREGRGRVEEREKDRNETSVGREERRREGRGESKWRDEERQSEKESNERKRDDDKGGNEKRGGMSMKEEAGWRDGGMKSRARRAAKRVCERV